MADNEGEPLNEDTEQAQVETEVNDQVQDEATEQEAEPGEEIVFSDGAAPAPGDDNATIREMREALRRQAEELKELRKSSAPQQIDPGPKPTLESCGYDEEAFESALDEWKERKSAADKQQASSEQQSRQVREQFAKDEERYRTNRVRLTFADVDEVEQVALAKLDQIQHATIVATAKDAAKVLYALGKHPGRLAELSQIQNPLKLAYAVAEFERSFSIMPRRQVTQPEEIATGSAPLSVKADKEEQRLEAEAARTKDYTKLFEFRRSKKQKAA